MNLFDTAVVYTVVPTAILALDTKVSLLAALEVYRLGSTATLSADREVRRNLSPYELRKRTETTRDLLQHGVIRATEGGLALLSLDMEADRMLARERIVLPSKIDFRSLTASSLKALLACYSLARYSRKPFQIELTQAELSSKANVAEKSLRAALAELTAHRLIRTEKVWRTATRISLLDPESGTELFYIGKFYRDRLERIPVFDRYKLLLQDYDPRDQLRHSRGPKASHTVHCPFCTRKGSARTLVFEADELEGVDRWRCFQCKRSGDSARLWAKLEPWTGKRDWRMLMAETCGPQPVVSDPAHVEAEAWNS